jgi:hypothetical protein
MPGHNAVQSGLKFIDASDERISPTKNSIFWDVMPRGSCENRRSGGANLHHKGEHNQLADHFHSDDGGDAFL